MDDAFAPPLFRLSLTVGARSSVHNSISEDEGDFELGRSGKDWTGHTLYSIIFAQKQQQQQQQWQNYHPTKRVVYVWLFNDKDGRTTVVRQQWTGYKYCLVFFILRSAPTDWQVCS